MQKKTLWANFSLMVPAMKIIFKNVGVNNLVKLILQMGFEGAYRDSFFNKMKLFVKESIV
jgi:hypothetical protein